MLLGSKPEGRHTEQHDIFFTVGSSLKDCVPDIQAFWPEAGKTAHIDAWRNVRSVNGYDVKVVERKENNFVNSSIKLFFINLGGYKPGEFEEYHYKLIVAAADRDTAIREAKQTAFFKHNHSPHVDDKYGIDVDDIYNIADILPAAVKEKYSIELSPAASMQDEDEIQLGYFRLDKL